MAKGSVRKKGKKWYYRFYVEDESGRQVQREFAGTESKSETEALLRKAMEDYEAKKFVAKSENATVGMLLDMCLYEYLDEFKRDVFSHYDCMTLAEAPMVSPKKALEYITEDDTQVLDMMIQFKTQEADCLFTDFRHLPFSLRKMKRAFSAWQTKLDGKGWNMLYLENHDHPRIVSRYGSEKYRVESAKMLAAAYLFLKGTPFIYQGQEIGMTNWRPESPDMYEDVQTIWQYKNVGTKKSPKKRLELKISPARVPNFSLIKASSAFL